MVYDSIVRKTILDAEKELQEIIEVPEIEAHNFDYNDLIGYGFKQDESGDYSLNEDY
jgi:hypothetical protein